jgi:hypothetical protein
LRNRRGKVDNDKKAETTDRLLAAIATFEAEIKEAIAERGETEADTMALALLEKMQQIFEEEKRQET